MSKAVQNARIQCYKNGFAYGGLAEIGSSSACICGRLGSDEFVARLSFYIPERCSGISVTLRCAKENTAAGAALGYRLFDYENEEYKAANSSFTSDGAFRFPGAESFYTINIERVLNPGEHHLYIFNGGSVYYGNYTEIRTNYETAVLYTPVPLPCTIYLNPGYHNAPVQSISAYFGESFPACVPPLREHRVIIRLPHQPGTEKKATFRFEGYYLGDKKYFDQSGNPVSLCDLNSGAVLTAKWSGGKVFFSAPSVPCMSFVGFRINGEGDFVSAPFTPAQDTLLIGKYRASVRHNWKFIKLGVAANQEDTAVRGLWSGFAFGREVLLSACNGYLWELSYENSLFYKRSCGEIPTSEPVFMFAFSGLVYILAANRYFVWDGQSINEVSGYRPLVQTGTGADGKGSALEEDNLLTGKKRAYYSPDGTAKTFKLPSIYALSLDFVKKRPGGESISAYSYNYQTRQLTFDTAPAAGINSIEMGYTDPCGTRESVCAMRFAELYNGNTDTRVFLYGNGTNRCIYSGIDADGEIRADYFPANNFADIGDKNTAITAMLRHGRSLMAFKHDSAWSITAGEAKIPGANSSAAFFITPQSRDTGCISYQGAALCAGRLITPDESGLIEWSRSGFGYLGDDGRNPKKFSLRVGKTISQMDLKSALPHFHKESGEYFLVGKDGTAIVYGSDCDAFYIYTGINALCLISYKGDLYFGTQAGELCRLSQEYKADRGEPIDAVWESGAMALSRGYVKKHSSMLWIALKPEDKTGMDIKAITDVGTATHMMRIHGDLNKKLPQLHCAALKSKGFTRYTLRFENSEADEALTIISADIRFSDTGISRRS